MPRVVRRFFILFACAALGASMSVKAHIVAEEPWVPVAAAYRTMLFLADIEPVPWDKIREAYERKHPAAVSDKSARVQIESLDRGAGDTAAAAIASAIAQKNRQLLYEAATRATSRFTRQRLAEAADALSTPGKGYRRVLEAQAVYRAFGSFVSEVDPEAAKRLGLAWLELTSAVGSDGLLLVGAVAPDKERFAAARRTIEDYLVANFEPKDFAPRKRMTPLPETVIAASGEIAVTPWLPPDGYIDEQDPQPRQVLNIKLRGIPEEKSSLIAYGDSLFDSPEILGPVGKALGVACSTCHNKGDINQRFFIPGVSHQPGAANVSGSFFNPHFNDHKQGSLDIPSLRGIRFTAPYGRNGRFPSLREFTRNVIVNEFGSAEPTPYMLDALVAYLFEFDFLENSKIDKMGRLTDKASAAARRGEIVFNTPFASMGNMACASCHIPSANFVDGRRHDIGSARADYPGSRGGAFDTPTLVNARFTAPYFHDGSLPTLASVVDWFDSKFSLRLTEEQKADLTAYVEAVGDADQPYMKFDDRNTPFRADFEELTTFAATLDTLLPKRDAFHADLLLRVIGPDMKATAGEMTNVAGRPQAYELASLLNGIRDAIEKNDWTSADQQWAKFKDLKAKYDKAMY
jgi:cytochrome c peroxidase